MKLLTRSTDYAIRAICHMAKNKDRLVSVPELTKALKIPRPFLRKILQILNKERIVRSYKGIGGGFRLARDAREIYLADIINVFQGPLKLNECLLNKELCPGRSNCPLKKRIDKIEKFVISEVRSITIKDLMGK